MICILNESLLFLFLFDATSFRLSKQCHNFDYRSVFRTSIFIFCYTKTSWFVCDVHIIWCDICWEYMLQKFKIFLTLKSLLLLHLSSSFVTCKTAVVFLTEIRFAFHTKHLSVILFSLLLSHSLSHRIITLWLVKYVSCHIKQEYNFVVPRKSCFCYRKARERRFM